MLEAGEILQGRYLIKSLLGQGGMGGVYLAIHQGLDAPVAVKEMTIDLRNPGLVEQFKREAQMLHQLQHENLPRVHDFFEDAGRHFLVMDYIDGQTLDQVVRLQPATEAEVLRWARDLCSVLGYLHSNNPPIIFRDLKPSNVMLGSDGRIKLIDFGIAKDFDVDTGLGTRTTVRGSGSPGFAAPEQYGSGTDVRTDVYALGATLYSLLTRVIPPDATDRAGGAQVLQPLEELCPLVSATTASVIEHMMTLNRNHRPASMQEVAAAFGFDEAATAIATRVGAATSTAEYKGGAETVLPSTARRSPASAARTSADPTGLEAASATRLVAAPETRMLASEPRSTRSAWVAVGVAGALLVAVLGGLGYWMTHQRLVVQTEPPDATIMVAGKRYQAPQTLEGLHWNAVLSVEVTKPGYDPTTTLVKVSDASVTIPLAQTKRTVSVSVTGGRGTGQLFADDAPEAWVGSQPCPVPLTLGQHHMRLVPPDGYSVAGTSIQMVKITGDTKSPITVRFKLAPNPGRVTVDDVPPGWVVKINGVLSGSGPRAIFGSVPAGKVTIVASGPGSGYSPNPLTVHPAALAAGGNLTVDLIKSGLSKVATLAPAPAPTPVAPPVDAATPSSVQTVLPNRGPVQEGVSGTATGQAAPTPPRPGTKNNKTPKAARQPRQPRWHWARGHRWVLN